MRLFVGLRPSAEFRNALTDLQAGLRSAGVAGRWMDSSNLHMTLAFIGEWPENVVSVLPEVTRPFSVTLSHIGVFPEAKVLWAGVGNSEALNLLAERVRHELAGNSIPFDPKPFKPHITLVRKPLVPASLDLSEITLPAVSMIVKEVCLYRSVHGENGMAYTVIGSSRKTPGNWEKKADKKPDETGEFCDRRMKRNADKTENDSF